MELSILGKDLLGEYEAKILFLLNRSTTSMSGRQISRTIVAPNSTVQRILSRFERIGLLRTDPHPGIVLYTINKKHILYNSLSAIFQIRKDFMDTATEIFADEIGVDSTIVLHGLTARHESRLEDDVDLFIVHPILDDGELEQFSLKLEELSRELENRIGNKVVLTLIDEKSFKNRLRIKDLALLEILKDGKPIAGRSLIEWAQGFGWKPKKTI